MADREHHRKLERLYASAPVNRFYLPSLTVGDGVAEVVIPVRTDFHHAAHSIHGAVYFKALDDACWFAVASVVEDTCVLTSSFNIHLLRPISEGELRASGRVVHASRRLYLAEGVLEDDKGRPLARGGGAFMRTEIPLSPEIGYR